MKLAQISKLTVMLVLLAGCATANPEPAKPVDVSQSKIAALTHADLQAAAKYATDHGYPARAGFWTALDTLLTAQEAQASACANAIAAMAPVLPSVQPAGIFTAMEMAAEAAGNFSGVPAAVKINCEPLPVPPLPALPRMP